MLKGKSVHIVQKIGVVALIEGLQEQQIAILANQQSWVHVFKIMSRLAPVHLFQMVSRLALSFIFQQQKIPSLAFCVIVYRISKTMSHCFRVCNFCGGW